MGQQGHPPDAQHPVPTTAGLAAMGERARRAAASGASTVSEPELAPALEAIRLAGGADASAAHAALAAGAPYHESVRLCARHVLAREPGTPPDPASYVAKASAELEPMLALWPDVLVLPSPAFLSSRDLILWRAFPVHPLRLLGHDAWADGGRRSPADYLFHDLDHARFKVREDLLALDIVIPDAYANGTTIEPVTGRHRTILPAALGRVGPVLWERADERLALAQRLLRAIDAQADAPLAAAAELLLFEIVHEKSLPLEARVLVRELRHDGHAAKLRHKAAAGFYGKHPPSAASVARLDDARRFLGAQP